MAYTQRVSPELRILLSNTLRCHGFEKNLQAISLVTPEYQKGYFSTTPEIIERLPEDAKHYARGEFKTDYARYHELTQKICDKNGGKEGATLSEEELQEQIGLRKKIGQKLNVAIVKAVLQDSGLFSAEDIANDRVRVSDAGMVEVQEGFTPTQAKMDAARDYIERHQPVHQTDGSWKSVANSRPEGGERQVG